MCVSHLFSTSFRHPFHFSTVLNPHFSKNLLPATVGTTFLDIDTKHFHTKTTPKTLRLGPRWGGPGSHGRFRNALKTNIISRFPLFGPNKPTHVRITLAFRCLSDTLFIFQPFLTLIFLKILSLPSWGPHFWISIRSIFKQKQPKNTPARPRLRCPGVAWTLQKCLKKPT